MTQFLSEVGKAITPNCDREDCRIVETGHLFVPAVWSQTVYDKYGNVMTPTQQQATRGMRCLTCEKTWNHTS